MKTPLRISLSCLLLLLAPLAAHAQVNSGSTGADGAFNPTTNTVVDMSEHPTGIYHYTSVNVPTNVTVTFIPNANNTPVVWLVKSNCIISGTVDVSGPSATGLVSSVGGPGGYRGGNGGSSATAGQGPGGGTAAVSACRGVNASFGSGGGQFAGVQQSAPGVMYGNDFLLPLLGGSGGGGASGYCGGSAGGAGGGGAILIAASQSIRIDGSITASGGNSIGDIAGGAGSGGAIRLVTQTLLGSGQIACPGGTCVVPGWSQNSAGSGRIRLDFVESIFGGALGGTVSQGFQPIIIPAVGQGVQLNVITIGTIPVSASPTGVLVTPDAIIAGQQSNPVAIVVRCTNLPLNTPVTVTVKPANGATISAVGYNTTGTLASSTATVSLNMPRGGGLIYATAATAP